MKIFQLIIIFALLVTASVAQSFNSEHFAIEKLSDGVYAVIHKTGGYAICNSGIIDLGDETLVFDCFISPKAAEDLKKAAEELTGNKVKYVVNSHFHNDHVRGNQVFADVQIISTQRTAELIEEITPEELEWEAKVIDDRIETTSQKLAEETDSFKLEELKMWMGYYKAIKESQGNYKITLPNTFMEDTLVIKGTEREAVLFTKGKGHTESDIVLWLPDDKILFATDLLFVNCHPWLGDGFPEEWIAYLTDLKRLKAKFIVPGHGELASEEDIDEIIHYIITINNIVDNAIANNLTEEQLKETKVPDEFEDWWFSRFFISNLVFLYDLKKEKRVEN
jgi:glyoxylase-like metal-dependent hydrolase (beta-lactamase superfamily II)